MAWTHREFITSVSAVALASALPQNRVLAQTGSGTNARDRVIICNEDPNPLTVIAPVTRSYVHPPEREEKCLTWPPSPPAQSNRSSNPRSRTTRAVTIQVATPLLVFTYVTSRGRSSALRLPANSPDTSHNHPPHLAETCVGTACLQPDGAWKIVN
jgi:hypothetical protein